MFATIHHLQSDPNVLIVYEAWQVDKATFFSTHCPPDPKREAFIAAFPRLLTSPTSMTVEWLVPFSERVAGHLIPQQMGEQSVGLWVRLRAKPQEKNRLLSLLRSTSDAMRHEADFLNTWEHSVEGEDESTIVMYEEWSCSAKRFLPSTSRRSAGRSTRQRCPKCCDRRGRSPF